MKDIELSIIVPVFNEITRLDIGLPAILAYSEQASQRVEVVLVDDGSSDGTAERIAEQIQGREDVRLIRLPKNRGKGAAVRTGMLAASGAVRLFTDIDLSVPIETADAGQRRYRGTLHMYLEAGYRELSVEGNQHTVWLDLK